MIANLIDSLMIFSAGKQISLYKKTENGNKIAYLPATDRFGVERNKKEFNFVSWKDIIA